MSKQESIQTLIISKQNEKGWYLKALNIFHFYFLKKKKHVTIPRIEISDWIKGFPFAQHIGQALFFKHKHFLLFTPRILIKGATFGNIFGSSEKKKDFFFKRLALN